MKDAPVRMTTCNGSGCIEIVRKKGVPDRVILQCLLGEILNDGLDKNMMITSDNPDFKLIVDIMITLQ